MTPSHSGHHAPERALAAALEQLEKGTAIADEVDPMDREKLAGVAHRPPPGMRLLKFGTRSIVGEYTLPSGLPVVLKYYFPKTLAKRLSYGVLGSRCRRSWRAAHAFNSVGVSTPPAIAIEEFSALRGLFLRHSFLATRRVEGTPMDRFVGMHRSEAPRLEALAEMLGRQFAIMAGLRMVHGDLKASNILIDSDERPHFIDLDASAYLLKPDAWRSAWRKDMKRFLSNWKDAPEVLACFRSAVPAEHRASGDPHAA